MRLSLALVIVSLSISTAFGQPAKEQSVGWVLYFAQTDSRQGMQEITNAIRAVSEIPALLDAEKRMLSLDGSIGQVELAEWVFNELDQPAGAQFLTKPNATPNRYSYQLPTGSADTAAVFSFASAPSPAHIQETVNTIRALAELVRLMPVNERRLIVLRGEPARVAFAEWLFHQLDQPANAQPGALPASPQEYRLPPGIDRDHNDLSRVYYLAHAVNAKDRMQIVNTIRAATKITRLMPISEPSAIVLRANDQQAADADQVIRQLDQPAAPVN